MQVGICIPFVIIKTQIKVGIIHSMKSLKRNKNIL